MFQASIGMPYHYLLDCSAKQLGGESFNVLSCVMQENQKSLCKLEVKLMFWIMGRWHKYGQNMVKY